jgi:hypothetical protein
MLLRARLSEVSWARPAVSPPVAKIGHNRTRSTKFFFSAMGGRQAVLISQSRSVLSPSLKMRASEGAVRNAVGIRCGAFSGNMKVSFQAARSIS